MITRFATLTSRLSVLFAFLLVLAACGGGGGGGGGFLPDDDGDDDAYFLSLALLDLNGDSTNTVTSTMPATLQVKVTRNNRNGKAIAEALVSADTDIGTLSPATSLTDSNGIATFELTAENELGAGAISVSVTNEDGLTTEGTLNFQITAPGLRLGHFDGNAFIENEIGVNPSGNLAYRGSAELVIDIVDEDGNRVDSTESVVITSDCLATGDSTLEPASPLETSTGSVRTTYTASRCSGTDELTATLDGGDGVAFAAINIGSPQANSLTFVSAEPNLIVLKGTGGGPNRQESAVVTFQVIDGDNNPLPDVEVDFSLTTEIGGLGLTPQSAISDEEGLVEVTVRSGDVATVVRVIATVAGGDGSGSQSTVSDVLTVSTGLPDQNSISLSVEGGFVVENGFTMDGIERNITVRMADKFNNPVPDGTSAVFTTEYGAIDPSCETGMRNGERVTNTTPRTGECTVLWTSGEPRYPTLDRNLNSIRTIDNPEGYDCPSHNGSTGPCPDDLGPVRGGRSTILVTAIGEESFIDRNGNGVMDEDEQDLFSNMPEAFIDHNEDGIFNPAAANCENSNSLACVSGFEETFVDFNNDNRYNSNKFPARYNGLLCPVEGDGIWCSRDLINVRDQTVLILSYDDGSGWDFLLTRNERVEQETREGSEYTVYVSDIFNNKPAAGSTIRVEAGGGCEIISETSFTVPASASYGAFGFPLVTDGDGSSGTVNLTLEPEGEAAPYTESFTCVSFAPPDPNSP